MSVLALADAQSGEAPLGASQALLHQLQQQLRARGLRLALAEQLHHGDGAQVETPQETPGLQPLVQTLLLSGACVELNCEAGVGAHSLALRLLAQGLARRQHQGWLCVVSPHDAGGALQAAAVMQLGVPLHQLLVLRPPLADLPRFAVRAARSGAFWGMLIDATQVNDLHRWRVALRRLALAAEDVEGTFFVLTSPFAKRPQGLCVAARAWVRPADDDVEEGDENEAQSASAGLHAPPSYALQKHALLDEKCAESVVVVQRHRQGMLGSLPVPPFTQHLEAGLWARQQPPAKRARPLSLKRKEEGRPEPQSRRRRFR